MTPQEAKDLVEQCGLNIEGIKHAKCESVVISAIEKQIPKKVKYLNRHGDGPDYYNKDYFNCPSCGRRLRNKQKDAYCGRCGQALDWSDNE